MVSFKPLPLYPRFRKLHVYGPFTLLLARTGSLWAHLQACNIYEPSFLHASRSFCVRGFFFGPGDGDEYVFRNVGEVLPEYTASHPIN
jgi:hypothetical protein